MPRPLKVDRPIEKKVSLPASIVAQVDLQLYSVLEGKVPHAAWARLVEGLLKDWLMKQTPREDLK